LNSVMGVDVIFQLLLHLLFVIKLLPLLRTFFTSIGSRCYISVVIAIIDMCVFLSFQDGS